MPTNKYAKFTISSLRAKKEAGEKITVLTAYDFPTAGILDECGIDVILVGDTLGMVVLGYENTVPVTMEDMIHHTKAVTRAVKRALVIGDMPYFSFHLSIEESIANASRFLKEGGAGGVKIEGASKKRLKLIEALTEAEIPAFGHVGLTPQSICRLGQYSVQGTSREEAARIISGAQDLERAGALAVVLEAVPMEVAEMITGRLKIPTIGIGAGPHCDGQVLVFHDLVGFKTGFAPKFVKKYADLNTVLTRAVLAYKDDVCKGKFPDDRTSYHLNPEVAARLVREFRGGAKRRKGAAR